MREHYARRVADPAELERFQKRHRYYYASLARLLQFHIPPGARVLEVGCGTGDLLAALKPARGVGIDASADVVAHATEKHPDLTFIAAYPEEFELDETFDYVVLCNTIGDYADVQRVLERVARVSTTDTRICIAYYNALWEPALRLASAMHFRRRVAEQNWLSFWDLENLLALEGFEVIRKSTELMCPINVPLVAGLCNRFLVRLGLINHLGLVTFLVAKPAGPPAGAESFTCSVIIPARNEEGNIAAAVARTPTMGRHTEIIFVEGNSNDGTAGEIERVITTNPDKDLALIRQGTGRGKGDAVRKGFAAAKGDVLMILDADLTVPPEDLPKFFDALVAGRGEFINGTRLVYPLEEQAMRFLNKLGNRFFSLAFTWLLEQRFRDTLCGTKVLRRRDYDRIAANRHYFGEFDPFGDFDLIFGAAKADMKIIEVPVRYRARTYGETNISRFRHGWLLLKMTWFAARKLKWR
ncbi:MAG: glycosyltransferase [Phycisphaerae bacterium]|nr:glycosyltransferase [Phycisphaerae bacterium]